MVVVVMMGFHAREGSMDQRRAAGWYIAGTDRSGG